MSEGIEILTEERGNELMDTNWYVITGPPCSGKTTLIKSLADAGFLTNPDISRRIIENLLATGQTLPEIYEKAELLQQNILIEMLANADTLNPSDLIFHDYSFPDNLPYLQLLGLEIKPEFQKAASLYKYKAIFICKPLDLESDGVRIESHKHQLFLYGAILACYQNLGYTVYDLPVVSVKERLQIICDVVNRQLI
jgi:predicted ATPase